MRQFISGLMLLLTLGLLASASVASAPQTKTTPATVTFRDAEGDRIMSDGAAYVHGGQRGLEVQLWTCADCSQDLTIGTFQSRRTLYLDYSGKVPGSGSGPTGVMYDNAFVNVPGIATMSIGEIRTTKASFNTAVGYFRWLGSPYPAGGWSSGNPYGSQAVIVERTSAQTWDVHTPTPPNVVIEPGYTAGDLSVLLKSVKNVLTPIGLYHMPFGLTVTCSTCL